MKDLADRYGISVETVEEFYYSLDFEKYGYTRKRRTEEFFDLYFEEVK